jgi:hypothetical protein
VNLFKTSELAEIMRVTERYLIKMRKRGEGPPYIRIRNLIRYPESGVNEFIKSNLIGGA